MSLNGALQVGRSALLTSQAALQVAGNNLANAATVGYSRRTVHLAPASDEVVGRGFAAGQGVQLVQIRREVDAALQARFRDAVSRESGAQIDQRFLGAIESLQNELSDSDISSQLSSFFNAFSELANSPNDHATRAVVVEQGQAVAESLNSLRSEYSRTRDEIDQSLGVTVSKVNDLLDRIELLNGQISQTEQGVGEQSALRDQRDALLDELAQHIDISVIEQSNGSADVFVHSVPIVLNGQSRGIELRTKSVNGQIEQTIRVAADGTQLDVASGSLGALLRQREETVQPAMDAIDNLAGQLIFQVNRLHSQGQGTAGQTTVTGATSVVDPTAVMNTSAAGLDFPITNGSFFIHVTHQTTGLRTTHRIDVNGDTMSLNDLINQINTVVGVPNVTASLTPERQLKLLADAGYEISFSDDTSGALASLGVNTFFTGSDAATIGVNPVVQDNLSLLAAGAGHVAGSGDTALAIAQLQDGKLDELNGSSLREFWQNAVSQNAVRADAANNAVQSSQLVRDSISAQKQAVSGVSIDEETISMLTYQRQFQAAARFINVIDETLRTLLSIG